MKALRHLDKVIFAVLLVLALWYGWHRYSSLTDLRDQDDAQIQRAVDLAQRIGNNVMPSPERDSSVYSGAPMRRWDRVPAIDQLYPKLFYPDASSTGRNR